MPLSLSDYSLVRQALDVTLTEDDLPDSVLGSALYEEAARDDVLAVDPEAESRTGSAARRVARALVYFTAARVAPVLPRLLQEQIENDDVRYRYQVQAKDWEAEAARLRGLAQAELAAYLNDDGRVETLSYFGTACGRRGR